MKEDALCTSSTHPVDRATMSVEKTQKACKAVCIKDMIIPLLTHSLTISQLDLYFHCTNDSFSFTPFISPDNYLSLPRTLTISRTLALGHPSTHTHFPSHLTTTQRPCPLCFSLVSLWSKQDNRTIWLDYAGKSRGNPSHPLCSSECPISTVLPACCIRQKHG